MTTFFVKYQELLIAEAVTTLTVGSVVTTVHAAIILVAAVCCIAAHCCNEY